MASPINKIQDRNTRAFAEACYSDNSKPELEAGLQGEADQSDLRQWSITSEQWKEAISAALDEMAQDAQHNHDTGEKAMANQLKVTDVQIFDFEDKFSANIIINDLFVIQLGTDGEFDIPRSVNAYWKDEAVQDAAAESLDADAIAEACQIPTDRAELAEKFNAEVM